MPVLERISSARRQLTPAERKVAEVVAADPTFTAFATVADVAARAGTSGPTVVRLATKLGFDGFGGLQADAQADLTRRLRPAAERIRQPAAADVIEQTLAVEEGNVRATLDGLDRDAFDAVVAALTDRRRRVLVMTGEAARPAGMVLAGGLDALREGVELAEGSEVAVARRVAGLLRGDVVLAMELRRYERWVVRAAAAAVAKRCRVIAVSDSLMSPLADGAAHALVVHADGAGPFDSLVGAVALANALVAGAAATLRSTATRRIDAVEAVFNRADLLTD